MLPTTLSSLAIVDTVKSLEMLFAWKKFVVQHRPYPLRYLQTQDHLSAETSYDWASSALES